MKGYKEYDKWSDEEIEILVKLFNKYVVSCKKYSKFVMISNALRKKGYNRTTKAVSRKSFSLGLRNYKVEDEDKVEVNCSICGKVFSIQKRYSSSSNLFCSVKCRKEHKKKVNRIENKTDRRRTYNREYKRLNSR